MERAWARCWERVESWRGRGGRWWEEATPLEGVRVSPSERARARCWERVSPGEGEGEVVGEGDSIGGGEGESVGEGEGEGEVLGEGQGEGEAVGGGGGDALSGLPGVSRGAGGGENSAPRGGGEASAGLHAGTHTVSALCGHHVTCVGGHCLHVPRVPVSMAHAQPPSRPRAQPWHTHVLFSCRLCRPAVQRHLQPSEQGVGPCRARAGLRQVGAYGPDLGDPGGSGAGPA